MPSYFHTSHSCSDSPLFSTDFTVPMKGGDMPGAARPSRIFIYRSASPSLNAPSSCILTRLTTSFSLISFTGTPATLCVLRGRFVHIPSKTSPKFPAPTLFPITKQSLVGVPRAAPPTACSGASTRESTKPPNKLGFRFTYNPAASPSAPKTAGLSRTIGIESRMGASEPEVSARISTGETRGCVTPLRPDPAGEPASPLL
mmetsp:Transcript_26231/g.46530  ORF Transcript_26231/g.46530 Transcript_26231/m.46530 type:complete len:201 (-) Transcript_26231:319-921(-)